MKQINIKLYEAAIYENPFFDRVANIDYNYPNVILNIHIHNLRVDVNVLEWK